MNFGRMPYSFSSFPLSLFSLQLNLEKDPSRLPLHLPLLSLTPQPKPLSCSPWTQGMGGAREDLGGDPLHFFSPPPLPTSTPNRQSAPPLQHHPDPSTQRDPALTSPSPLSLAGVTRECAHCPEASRGSHRPALRHQTPLSTGKLNQSSPAAQSPHRPCYGPVLHALCAA
jgi:hypothetical protein